MDVMAALHRCGHPSRRGAVMMICASSPRIVSMAEFERARCLRFFDRVNHDGLMARVAARLTDKRVLKLIRAFLNAGVMEDGLVPPVDEGTPQGGPLSPLLSNLVLDDLDKELTRRGSERRIAPKALDKFKAQIRDKTRRTRGISLLQLIKDLTPYLIGWRGYFGFCQTPRVLPHLEAAIRRRLRMYLWRQWKNGPNRFKELRRRGVPKFQAAVAAGSPTGYWRMSGHPAVQQALRTKLVTSTHSVSPDSTFPLKHNLVEPPCTAPYARWCGRGGVARRPPIPIFGLSRTCRPISRMSPIGGRKTWAHIMRISHFDPTADIGSRRPNDKGFWNNLVATTLI